MEATIGDKGKRTITMALPADLVVQMQDEADRQERAKYKVWEFAAREYLRRRSRKSTRPTVSPSAS